MHRVVNGDTCITVNLTYFWLATTHLAHLTAPHDCTPTRTAEQIHPVPFSGTVQHPHSITSSSEAERRILLWTHVIERTQIDRQSDRLIYDERRTVNSYYTAIQ